MSPVESIAWLGKAKSEPVKMSEVDNGTWLGKADAAKLLKVSTRSLERDAQRGAIARMYLPRQAGEKSARAVYSRVDIEALLGEESAQSDRLITKKEACELLDKSTRSLNLYVSSGKLPAHYIKGPGGGREPRFDREQVLRLKVEFETPVDSATYREHPGLPAAPVVSNDANGNVQPAGTALARIDPDAVKNVAEAFAVALRNGLQPPVAKEEVKPWLSIREASAYSGLPEAYLLSEARHAKDGVTPDGFVAIDVGMGTKPRWRVQRDSLGGWK